MKILVTGAAGFIGFHVSRHLCGRGDEVVGIDNLNDYYEVTLKEARLSCCGRFQISVLQRWILLIARILRVCSRHSSLIGLYTSCASRREIFN